MQQIVICKEGQCEELFYYGKRKDINKFVECSTVEESSFSMVFCQKIN
ncbi:hypothetical protein HOI26_00870 [Candidatus Woesearchaeota archaeon]|nr:hypothetical protein [Candidatus Woesearchaeota archaeon]